MELRGYPLYLNSIYVSIYEVFPLLCPLCGGQMRIIAFITYSADICQILDHIGADAEPPCITPARGPPPWDGADVPKGEGVEVEPDWDEAAQPAPDFGVDQRVWSCPFSPDRILFCQSSKK